MSSPDEIIAWHLAQGNLLFWTPKKGSYGIAQGEKFYVFHNFDPDQEAAVEALRSRLWRSVVHGTVYA